MQGLDSIKNKVLIDLQLYENWIRIGSEEEWLKRDENKLDRIMIDRGYSDDNFGLTISEDGRTLLLVKETPQLAVL